MVMLSVPASSLIASEGSPIINGVYPFAGVYMTGKDKPVVSFKDKDGHAMLGVSIIDNLSPSWGFEATLAFIPDKDDSIYFFFHGNMITNLRITDLIYPYLTFGAGIITVADPGEAVTNLALNGGMGLKLRLTSSTHLRFDFRDYAHFLEEEVQHFQHMTIGAGYSFHSVLFEW
jgi:hypothetical protein